MKNESKQILKLYVSNFLTGLVFWYGIEKLFMTHIGIDAVGVGIVTAILLAFNLIFDIPSGIIADRWNRKGMLAVSAVALAVSSIILGLSNGLALYIVGYLFYGVYVVSTSGTYQAITYDSLHEENRASDYSKIVGRAYGLFLVGAGVANIASGFIAGHTSYQATFFLTVLSCVINFAVILSLHEPTFHKAEKRERALLQLGEAAKVLTKIKLLKVLAVIMSALAIVELFKGDFGQLYIMRYTDKPEVIGLIWAAFAFTWAFGSFVAHRLRKHLNLLITLATLPLVAMSFIDHWFSLVLFMVQAIASAALFNQIETRVQENTPSHVRASVLSVLSALGRAISIPASLILGYIFYRYNALVGLWFVAGIAVIIWLYWLVSGRNLHTDNET